MAQNTSKKPSKSRLSIIRNVKDEGNGNVADWASVTPKVLVELITVVAGMGGATRFGYTRDGGAYSVGIYLDDDRETFYYKPGDDIDDALTQLAELLSSP